MYVYVHMYMYVAHTHQRFLFQQLSKIFSKLAQKSKQDSIAEAKKMMFLLSKMYVYCMHVRTYVCMYVCMHACMYVCHRISHSCDEIRRIEQVCRSGCNKPKFVEKEPLFDFR
jgi:hypothetical protein